MGQNAAGEDVKMKMQSAAAKESDSQQGLKQYGHLHLHRMFTAIFTTASHGRARCYGLLVKM